MPVVLLPDHDLLVQHDIQGVVFSAIQDHGIAVRGPLSQFFYPTNQKLSASFLLWWLYTSDETWQYHELVSYFVDYCWEVDTAAWAAGLLQK